MMRRNFNDPAIGAAFGNLASLFAPPSGGDMANFALARGRNEENARLAQYFDMSQDPSTPRDMLDRVGIGAGRFTPVQSHFAVTTDAETKRATNAADNARALQTNQLDNQTRFLTDRFNRPLTHGQVVPQVDETVAAVLGLPALSGQDGAALGAPAPLPSETQVKGAERQDLRERGLLTDDMLVDTILGERSPVQAVGPEGRATFMSPGEAVRSGAEPFRETSVNYDNYLVLGADGLEPVAGRTLPDGRIVTPAGEDVTDRVVQRTGTTAGTQFEVGPDGAIRFSQGGGLTNRTAGRLEDIEFTARRTANNMSTLFETLSADALGARGVWNEQIVNRGLAQLYPDVARLDVTAQQSFLRNAILQDARTLLQNDRLNREDREAIGRLMPNPDSFWESLPRARAAVAVVALLAAYNAEFAGETRAGGDALPPLDGRLAGQLVDRGVIPPNVAQAAVEALFAARGSGSGAASAAPPSAPGGAPATDPSALIGEARDAITRGADPAAVRRRLQEMGIDPGGL